MRRVPRGDESGFTLSEVCIALVILSVSIVAVIGSVGSALFASRVHRDIATSDAVVRQYAEQLVAAPYQACATAATPQYQPTGVAPGYTASIVKVQFWNGSNTNAQYVDGCVSDPGVQRLTLKASRANGLGTQTLEIVKRSS
jgi:Tfp pilus assembly protein PilV